MLSLVNISIYFLQPSAKLYKTTVYPCYYELGWKINTKFCSKYVLIIWAYSLLISKQHFKVDSNNELIIKDLHPCCWYLPLINYVCFSIKLSFLNRLFVCFYCWFISCDVTVRESVIIKRESKQLLTFFIIHTYMYIFIVSFLLKNKKIKANNLTI